MTAAEVQFLAAGQQPTPPADDQPKPQARPTRDCPICGGTVRLANNRLVDHNEYVMSRTGIREGNQFCDGSGRRIKTNTTATRTTPKEK